MCVGMTESLRCSPETVTVLSVNQLYPSMEFKKKIGSMELIMIPKDLKRK